MSNCISTCKLANLTYKCIKLLLYDYHITNKQELRDSDLLKHIGMTEEQFDVLNILED